MARGLEDPSSLLLSTMDTEVSSNLRRAEALRLTPKHSCPHVSYSSAECSGRIAAHQAAVSASGVICSTISTTCRKPDRCALTNSLSGGGSCSGGLLGDHRHMNGMRAYAPRNTDVHTNGHAGSCNAQASCAQVMCSTPATA